MNGGIKMKYIHEMQTSKDINEKLDYLKSSDMARKDNIGWMIKTNERLSKLLSHCNCHECGEFIQDAGSEVQSGWIAVGNSLLCKECFKKTHL